MIYLLDTNAVIALLNGDQSLADKVTCRPASHFGLSSIVLYELYFGAFRSRRTAVNLGRLSGLLFEQLNFDREDAVRAGELRAALAAAGTPIGDYDVLIAGQALARDLVVVTHNMREFSRVPGLRVEDWQD